MDNALFVGLSHQMVLRRNLDILAHNLANMTTTAYKAERPLFKTFLTDIRDAEGRPTKAQYVTDFGMTRDTAEGVVRRTENPLDIAINGKGFFAVETPAGERYTRAGQFRLDAEGTLITAAGDKVLDTNRQPLTFAPEETDFRVARDGAVSTSQGPKGRLLVVEFADESKLERVGETYFRNAAPAAPQPAEKTVLLQGMIEDSNVVPILEMSTLVEVMRAYSSSTQLVKSIEDTSERAIRVLGEVR